MPKQISNCFLHLNCLLLHPFMDYIKLKRNEILVKSNRTLKMTKSTVIVITSWFRRHKWTVFFLFYFFGGQKQNNLKLAAFYKNKSMLILWCVHRANNRGWRPGKRKVYTHKGSRGLPIFRALWQTPSLLWLWNRMVFVSVFFILSSY